VSWSLYPQFVTGYGETLLRYSQNVMALRVGLALDDRLSWSAALR
jgi:outer membrane phospholipase A